MKINEAIQLAQSRGDYKAIKPNEKGRIHDKFIAEILLDKDFWQAIGKAIDHNEYEKALAQGVFVYSEKWDWLYQWHRFIDHLAEGKDINSFFETITPQT